MNLRPSLNDPSEMRYLYSFLYSIALSLLLPFEYAKRPPSERRRWLREKFGYLTLPRSNDTGALLWIHAVSMGEVLSAVPFIRELKRRYPSLRIVLSTITDTGQKVARERLSDSADIIYLPFDLVSVCRLTLRRVRPAAFIAVETELWPNTFRVLKEEGIPILVMNGRVSENSFKGYQRIRFFIKDVLECVDMFCMQDTTYAERIRSLGADAKKITVVGNFKFDIIPPNTLRELPALRKGPVILAGSTHEGEEELIVSVFDQIKGDFPGLTLIVAPRHPERFRAVAHMIKAKGLPYEKRSEIRGGVSGNLIILDTVGELGSFYRVCDIAVMGGSFIGGGGHNPLEPAFWGKPVLCGPSMENFPFISDFYKEGAAEETDRERLSTALKELLRSPEKRKTMGEKAKALYHREAGAVRRALTILERYLNVALTVTHQKPLP